MPVWVTIKDVPRKFRSNALDIVESLGLVFGKNRGDMQQNDQKFCVAFTAGEPFPITVEVVNPVNGKKSLLVVDYNNLSIRCRHCLSTSHLVKDCSTIKGRGSSEEHATWEVQAEKNAVEGSGKRIEVETQVELTE